MSHHFIDLLDDLRGQLAKMTSLVQTALEQAVDALMDGDPKLAQAVVEGDSRIDDEEVKVERTAIDMLALYQPAASDLRLVTTIIKANNDFERIADCAVNIAQRILPLSHSFDDSPYEVPADLRVMATSVVATLRDTIRAFHLVDDRQARAVLRGDDVVDALYHQIVQDILIAMQTGPASASNRNLAIIMVAKNLERIADHCTNIAENVIYVQSGKIIRHQRSEAMQE